MSKHPATPQILKALQRGETITPQDALQRWGVFRLAVIIHNLRQAGHSIQTRIIRTPDHRYGEYYM